MAADGAPVTITAVDSHTAAASILLPLGVPSTAGDHIVLYAHNPGAFTDLAADARTVLGAGGDIVMDGHLPPPTASATDASAADLADRSTIDQAVGFLIGQGHPPEEAMVELRRRAATAGASAAWMANHILQTSGRPDPDEQRQGR